MSNTHSKNAQKNTLKHPVKATHTACVSAVLSALLTGCGGAPIMDDGLSSRSSQSSSSASASSLKSSSAQSSAASSSPLIIKPHCSDDSSVLYGERGLKLLTRYEYQNSLQALFKKPLYKDFSAELQDDTIDRMPSQIYTAIKSARLDVYDSNANNIATWAINTPGALPFSCARFNTPECATLFIDQWASLAYRRPLTFSEENYFTNTIVNATEPTAGLHWAIRTVLGSANFLYRSESGVKVSDVRTQGWRIAEVNNPFTRAEPIKIEAEHYAHMVGIQLENTLDTGGGQNVGYIDANDTLDYTLTAPLAGSYNVAFRVASKAGGGSFAVELNGVTQLTFTVPNTGDWQNWQTIRGFVDVSGNPSTLRIKALTPGFNLNWIEFVSVPEVVKSPTFLNFPQLNQAEAGAYVLDPYEYASALSYMYTAAPPDLTLLRAAARGDLEGATAVDAQIVRMMDSPMGQLQAQRFAEEWFKTAGIQNQDRNHPAFTSEVKHAMAQEVRELYKHVYNAKNLPVSELYSANYTFLDSTLSHFYGIPGGGGLPGEFVQVPTQHRGGILTTGAFLASYSNPDETHPVRRAVHLREDLLCQRLPTAHELGLLTEEFHSNLPKMEELMALGTLTTTGKIDILTQPKECAACHSAYINPLFAMDDFDFVGLPRKTLNGEVVQKGLGANGQENVPIDWVNKPWGAVYGLNDIASAEDEKRMGTGLRFSGVKDLSNKLSTQPVVEQCFMQRSYRFATGYAFFPLAQTEKNLALLAETPGYSQAFELQRACQSGRLVKRFEKQGKSVYEFYRSIGQSDAIRFRKDN